MMNILMITPLYPLPTKDNRTTKVCHYFAREWKKMGCNIIVIHFQHEYPLIWHLLVRWFGDKINHKFDGIFLEKRLKKMEYYVMDGVPVYRIPVPKIMPGRFSKRKLKQFKNNLQLITDERTFIPDILIGHMLSIDIIPFVNDLYKAKTCMISHGEPINIRRFPDYRELIASYDCWGFRSKAIKNNFEQIVGQIEKSFICYSGIPESFLPSKKMHNFSEKLNNFLYVGTLISRKHPALLPKALCEAYPEKDFNLVYVGEGQERGHISKVLKELDVERNVIFTGKIVRDEIIEQYDKADCFVMISHNEAYGLVYLEAMARGCIVIGSRNEGIDGVIVDGKNGFLCEAGNVKELVEIVSKIKKLSQRERVEISEEAIKTAKEFTDTNAAKAYLTNLKQLFRQ